MTKPPDMFYHTQANWDRDSYNAFTQPPGVFSGTAGIGLFAMTRPVSEGGLGVTVLQRKLQATRLVPAHASSRATQPTSVLPLCSTTSHLGTWYLYVTYATMPFPASLVWIKYRTPPVFFSVNGGSNPKVRAYGFLNIPNPPRITTPSTPGRLSMCLCLYDRVYLHSFPAKIFNAQLQFSFELLSKHLLNY